MRTHGPDRFLRKLQRLENKWVTAGNFLRALLANVTSGWFKSDLSHTVDRVLFFKKFGLKDSVCGTEIKTKIICKNPVLLKNKPALRRRPPQVCGDFADVCGLFWPGAWIRRRADVRSEEKHAGTQQNTNCAVGTCHGVAAFTVSLSFLRQKPASKLHI